MTVQKVISKDPKNENEKYLIFLDYILDKLKNGRPAGISLRNLVSDYKTEMGTIIDRQELKTFMQLYNGLYFDRVKSSIDRLKIKDKTIKILLKYGSIREYLKQQGNIDERQIKIKRLSKGEIIGIIGIILGVPSFIIALPTLKTMFNKSTDSTIKKEQTTSPIENKKLEESTFAADSLNIVETDSSFNKIK